MGNPRQPGPDVTLARTWADLYRIRGWNPLPSRPDAKRPFIRYAEYWDAPAPADLFDRFPTSNVQLMLGRHWRLLVIDLDGPEARERFGTLGTRPAPRTWATHSGGDGLHLWFTLPAGYPRPLPRAILWRGDGPHAAIERLCDRSLIMAPPSIHPGTGRRYRFLAGRSPKDLPMPAACPAWVLALKPVETPREAAPAPVRPAAPIPVPAGHYRAADVLAAIPDKVDLARAWGLRLAGSRPDGGGWISCHALGREDKHPSARLHAESGFYVDFGTGERLKFFDIAVARGFYSDWRDAVNDLGSRFNATEAIG